VRAQRKSMYFNRVLTFLNTMRLTVAQTIYNNRAFERLPELADALAEAGCSNPDSGAIAAGRDRTSAAAGWWIWCWGRSERRNDE
jgi:hypothetical protein